MPMQFETVARVGAGEARFDGADAVVKITDAPAWSSAGSTAAWQALFNVPTDGQAGGNLRYVMDADMTFSAAGGFMTAAGFDPTATEGFPVADEAFKHMGDTIRDAKFYLPTGVSMYVRLWWGSL